MLRPCETWRAALARRPSFSEFRPKGRTRGEGRRFESGSRYSAIAQRESAPMGRSPVQIRPAKRLRRAAVAQPGRAPPEFAAARWWGTSACRRGWRRQGIPMLPGVLNLPWGQVEIRDWHTRRLAQAGRSSKGPQRAPPHPNKFADNGDREGWMTFTLSRRPLNVEQRVGDRRVSMHRGRCESGASPELPRYPIRPRRPFLAPCRRSSAGRAIPL